jgi:hypothetical protein
MNAWDDKEFVAAVQKTRRKNLIIAALWSEVCLAMPALQALTDGYGVYAVVDASGSTSALAQDTAIRRIEQAGAVRLHLHSSDPSRIQSDPIRPGGRHEGWNRRFDEPSRRSWVVGRSGAPTG